MDAAQSLQRPELGAGSGPMLDEHLRLEPGSIALVAARRKVADHLEAERIARVCQVTGSDIGRGNDEHPAQALMDHMVHAQRRGSRLTGARRTLNERESLSERADYGCSLLVVDRAVPKRNDYLVEILRRCRARGRPREVGATKGLHRRARVEEDCTEGGSHRLLVERERKKC